LTPCDLADNVIGQSIVRGDLPPIAATLNNVLKRDAPGGRFRPGDSFFRASIRSPDHALESPAHA
jgi:hypothetical protein